MAYDAEGPDLLTLPEAAVLLRVSDSTAQRMAAAGQFPAASAIKIRGQWRVSRPRLMRYLHGEAQAS